MNEIGIYEKIDLLKEKIDGYYHANEECISVAEQKCNLDSIKYFKELNFSLDTVKGFMEEICL